MSSATRKRALAGDKSVGSGRPNGFHEPAKNRHNRASNHIKRVPAQKALREQLSAAASRFAREIQATTAPTKAELEQLACRLLADLQVSEEFTGWTMVMLASAYWRPKVAATPVDRRLLLLPGEIPHSSKCAAHTAAEKNGRQRPDCSACNVESLRARAEGLGYRVLWVEQSVAVLAALAGAEIDAVIGVAPLDLLEKAIDEIPQFDIPCMAVPLWEISEGASFDVDCVRAMIELPNVPADRSTPNYRPLMRAARQMFEPEQLELLAPRTRRGPRLAELNGQGAAPLDPLAATEAIAYDFLTRGGKHSRPFITLAVYDAMTGGHCSAGDAHRHIAELPIAVKRAAASIETFHKASLVHDDIEDDDQFRYGEPTVHRALGVPAAINVGDYLIGLGYRLVCRESAALGADAVSDIMDRLADCHIKLTEGQGAELLWRDTRPKQLSAAEAIEIYALKTAPAFEAALITGLRLAGPIADYVKPISEFARQLGIAFQIQNDLADWTADDNNKLIAAGDVLGGRPTVLWALALEGLPEPGRSRLEQLASHSPVDEAALSEIRALYQAADVFDKAARLVKQYENGARVVAESLEPAELRRLLLHLTEIVLKARR